MQACLNKCDLHLMTLTSKKAVWTLESFCMVWCSYWWTMWTIISLNCISLLMIMLVMPVTVETEERCQSFLRVLMKGNLRNDGKEWFLMFMNFCKWQKCHISHVSANALHWKGKCNLAKNKKKIKISRYKHQIELQPNTTFISAIKWIKCIFKYIKINSLL